MLNPASSWVFHKKHIPGASRSCRLSSVTANGCYCFISKTVPCSPQTMPIIITRSWSNVKVVRLLIFILCNKVWFFCVVPLYSNTASLQSSNNRGLSLFYWLKYQIKLHTKEKHSAVSWQSISRQLGLSRDAGCKRYVQLLGLWEVFLRLCTHLHRPK